MQSKHKGCCRAFTVRSQEWYAKCIDDQERLEEITIGMFDSAGGSTGNFTVYWTFIAQQAVPRLEAFDDSWNALWQFKDLLEWMASLDAVGRTPTPEIFIAKLKSLKILDRTTRVKPSE